jgi:glycosyltransferase involved in cell wall biosynthesis
MDETEEEQSALSGANSHGGFGFILMMFQRGVTGENWNSQRRLNIGLVPSFFMPFPATGGIEVYSLSLISEMNNLESPFRFTVFVSNEHRSLIPELNDHFTVIPVESFARNKVMSPLWHLFVLPFLAVRHEVDLLHLFAGNRRLSLFRPSRSVATVHDVYHYYSKEIYTISRHWYFRYLLSLLLKHYPNIIAVSGVAASDMERTLGVPERNIRIIRNGYDNRRFRVVNANSVGSAVRKKYALDRKFMLYVSALDHPRKNHVRLIDAYAQLKRSINLCPDLIFVGQAFWRENVIRTKIAEYHLEDSIRLLGYVPDEDLVAMYNLAEIFVHPSGLEGFGLPIIEAMACGLPAACADIPAFREIGGEAPVFFDHLDPVSIRNAMQTLLENESRYDECRLKGLKQAKQYSWEITAKEVIAYYSEILSQHIPRSK